MLQNHLYTKNISITNILIYFFKLVYILLTIWIIILNTLFSTLYYLSNMVYIIILEIPVNLHYYVLRAFSSENFWILGTIVP